jgi:hypothetical protein
VTEARLEHGVPQTAGWFIAAGTEPSLVLAVGARKQIGSVRYPVEQAAVRHGAGVTTASASSDEAYAAFGEPRPGAAPEFF